MRRSRSRGRSVPLAPSTASSVPRRPLGCSALSKRRASADDKSATVPPRQQRSERDVDAAEADRHPGIGSRLRQSEGGDPGEHECDAGQRDDAHRERAARDDARAVEEEPEGGERVDEAGLEQEGRQRRAGNQRRGQRERESPRGKRPQGAAASARLAAREREREGGRDDRFGGPDREPGAVGRLPRRDPCRRQRGHARHDLPHAGDRGESRRAFHRVADRPEVGLGALAQVDRSTFGYRWAPWHDGSAYRRAVLMSSTLLYRARPAPASLLAPACRPSAISSIIFALNAGRSSGFLLVTRPWSTTTSWSVHSTPAFSRSFRIEGYDVMRRPSATPASISVHGPWQIAATGFPSSKNARTNSSTRSSRRSLSGFMTPPGSTRAS